MMCSHLQAGMCVRTCVKCRVYLCLRQSDNCLYSGSIYSGHLLKSSQPCPGPSNITPSHTLITPSHTVTPHTSITPSHTWITPSHTLITPSHMLITPSHVDHSSHITPSHVDHSSHMITHTRCCLCRCWYEHDVLGWAEKEET